MHIYKFHIQSTTKNVVESKISTNLNNKVVNDRSFWSAYQTQVFGIALVYYKKYI